MKKEILLLYFVRSLYHTLLKAKLTVKTCDGSNLNNSSWSFHRYPHLAPQFPTSTYSSRYWYQFGSLPRPNLPHFASVFQAVWAVSLAARMGWGKSSSPSLDNRNPSELPSLRPSCSPVVLDIMRLNSTSHYSTPLYSSSAGNWFFDCTPFNSGPAYLTSRNVCFAIL